MPAPQIEQDNKEDNKEGNNNEDEQTDYEEDNEDKSKAENKKANEEKGNHSNTTPRARRTTIKPINYAKMAKGKRLKTPKTKEKSNNDVYAIKRMMQVTLQKFQEEAETKKAKQLEKDNTKQQTNKEDRMKEEIQQLTKQVNIRDEQIKELNTTNGKQATYIIKIKEENTKERLAKEQAEGAYRKQDRSTKEQKEKMEESIKQLKQTTKDQKEKIEEQDKQQTITNDKYQEVKARLTAKINEKNERIRKPNKTIR